MKEFGCKNASGWKNFEYYGNVVIRGMNDCGWLSEDIPKLRSDGIFLDSASFQYFISLDANGIANVW